MESQYGWIGLVVLGIFFIIFAVGAVKALRKKP